MDGNESIFVSLKEACRIVGLSRAQIDRLRRAGRFPNSFELTGAPNGKVGIIRTELFEWCSSRRRRTLRPLADASD
jgi:predicted DNA-binding transcriptional regulator AlpA